MSKERKRTFISCMIVHCGGYMRVSYARPNPNPPQPRVVYRPLPASRLPNCPTPSFRRYGDLPPTPRSATKVELVFPSAPYRRPNRPVSPFLHGVSATSAFPPFVHLNSRHPPTTPHLHPAPTESRCHTYCRAIYPSHMSMPSLLPRRTI